MQFSVIGQWLTDGCSPHTGKPVLETCRIVKSEDILVDGVVTCCKGHLQRVTGGSSTVPFILADYGCLFGSYTRYEVGKTYAIQPGRGRKAIGRTPTLASLRRQDVRSMTQEDAIARGFASVEAYLGVWCKMHDPQVELLYLVVKHGELGQWLGGLKSDWKQGVVWNPTYPPKASVWDDTSDIMRGLQTRPAELYDAWVLRFAGGAS